VGKTKLTQKVLEGLKAKAKRYNVLDSEVRGLGIVVFPSSTKSFFHVRKVQGWPQRTTLGVWPEYSLELAREKASELNSEFAVWKREDYAGPNPTKKAKSVPALGEVLEHYIENHLRTNAKNPIAAEKRVRWQFDRYLTAWRGRPLPTIRREHVRERHAEIAKASGPIIANRITTFVRALYGHATDADIALWDGINPASKPKKFLAPEIGRERTLASGQESATFFAELAKENHPDLRDAVLLSLFSGQRRGSVLAMKWADINMKHALWTVSITKSRKGVKPHTIPLTEECLTILRQRPRLDDVWVFPGRAGHLTDVKKPWQAFVKRTGIENLHFHDLRRSLASAQGDTGASKEVIAKTLGHADDSAATDIYDRSDRKAAVRSAMRKAAKSILSGGKVSLDRLLAVPRG
jgi:integrase